MPSSDYRFHGEGVGLADMAEAPRRERESKVKSVGVIAVVTVSLLALAGLLVFGSQPALTPEEIVGRDDYQGQQPPRHIFNLYSLKQNQQRREAEQANELAAADDESSASDDANKTSELPAKVIASRPEKTPGKAPAAEQNYVKAELLREPVSVISAVAAQAPPLDAETSVTVLPIYSIKGNQTNMRALPTTDAPILQTLNKGQTVTVFAETGEWVHVATNDGSGVSGYIHQSLLENLNK